VTAAALVLALAAGQGAAPGAARAAAAPDTTPAAVHGSLTLREGGRPLAFATIVADGPDGSLTVRSDDRGTYRLAGLEPGAWRLRARALDYASAEVAVTLPPGADVELDLGLELRPVSLPGLAVRARPDDGGVEASRIEVAGREEGTGRGRSELEAAGGGPGSLAAGLAGAARRALGSVPGAPGTLYLPGGTGGPTTVLLDEAPVVAPTEIAGLVPAFPGGADGSLRVDRAGAPARYAAGGTGLLRLETRTEDRRPFRASGSIGQLGGSARLAGTLGRGGFVVGGRSLAALEPGLLGGTGATFPFGYRDALAHLELPAGAGSVSATGFWNRESLEPAAGPFGTPLEWGNSAGSLRYGAPVGSGRLAVFAAGGRFRTAVPWGDAGGRLEARSLEARAGALGTARVGPARLEAGAGWEGRRLTHRTVGSSGSAPAVEPGELSGGVGATWGEAAFPLSDEVSLRAGLRADLGSGGALAFDPRLRLEWSARPGLDLHLAAGRSHGLLGREAVSGCAVSTDGCPRRLSLAGATHVAAGLGLRTGDGLRFRLEGYGSWWRGRGTTSPVRSAGADLRVGWEDGTWAAWADYSLMHERVDPADAGLLGPGGLRQLFLAGLRGRLPSGVTLELELRAGRGSSYTPLPVPSPGGTGERVTAGQDAPGGSGTELTTAAWGAAPREAYARLDVRLSRTWRAALFGASAELAPYVQVVNAAGAGGALFYWGGGSPDTGVEPVGSVPFLALVGVRWGL